MNLFVVVLSRVSSWNNATHSKNVIVVQIQGVRRIHRITNTSRTPNKHLPKDSARQGKDTLSWMLHSDKCKCSHGKRHGWRFRGECQGVRLFDTVSACANVGDNVCAKRMICLWALSQRAMQSYALMCWVYIITYTLGSIVARSFTLNLRSERWHPQSKDASMAGNTPYIEAKSCSWTALGKTNVMFL